MPQSDTGVDYEVLTTLPGGAPAYGESFARDGNIQFFHVLLEWGDVEEFRRSALGFTEFDPSNGNYFHRHLPMLNPYYNTSRAYKMDLVTYGRMPTAESVSDFDDTAAGVSTAVVGNTKPFFYPDQSFDDWPTMHKAIYRLESTSPHYVMVDDNRMTTVNGTAPATEMCRFIIRHKANNVRELRAPDANFKPPASDNVVFVNGFLPCTENEYTYEWKAVPFANIPRAAIDKCRLRINSSAFDARWVFPLDGSDPWYFDGYEAETMLFVDCKGDDLFYYGPSGEELADLQLIFRRKRVYDVSGNVGGHNHFLDATGNWIKPVRRTDPTRHLYFKDSEATPTADFALLFTPEA